MVGVVSVNMKKISAKNKVNRLLDENYRSEKTARFYDDGHRLISTKKTKENVFLIERPENYDKERKEKFQLINKRRAERDDTRLKDDDFRKSISKEELQKLTRKNVAQKRKLRADTVDTIGIVIQPDADFINSLDRDKQIDFFKDSLGVLKSDYNHFGKVETAVIHFDENTPHMQCLSTALNQQKLTSDAKIIFGNKSKMSEKQTVFADGLKAKGWDVERGAKRIDNPSYKNFNDEIKRAGYRFNRHNEKLLLHQFGDVAQNQRRNKEKEKELQQKEKNLQQRESKILKNESILNQNADELSEYRRRVLECQEQVKKKYLDRMKEIEERRQSLDAREAKIRRSDGVLVIKRTNLKKDKEKISEREKMVSRREDNVLERENEVEKLRHELQVRYEEQLEDLQKQKEAIDKKTSVARAYKIAIEEKNQKMLTNKKAVEDDFKQIKQYVFNGSLDSDKLTYELKNSDFSGLVDVLEGLKKEGQKNQDGFELDR